MFNILPAQGLGYTGSKQIALGLGSDKTPAEIVDSTTTGSVRRPLVRNVMARYMGYDWATTTHAEIIPHGSAACVFDVGTLAAATSAFPTPETMGVAAFECTQPALGTTKVMSRGSAYMGITGCAAGTKHSRYIRPSASAAAGEAKQDNAFTWSSSLLPTGILNPTDEEMIAMVHAVRSKRKKLT